MRSPCAHFRMGRRESSTAGAMGALMMLLLRCCRAPLPVPQEGLPSSRRTAGSTPEGTNRANTVTTGGSFATREPSHNAEHTSGDLRQWLPCNQLYGSTSAISWPVVRPTSAASRPGADVLEHRTLLSSPLLVFAATTSAARVWPARWPWGALQLLFGFCAAVARWPRCVGAMAQHDGSSLCRDAINVLCSPPCGR